MTLSKKTLYFNTLKIFATWFYSGKAPFAPGTCGSLATLPCVYALSYFYGYQAVAVFALLIAIIGIPIASSYAQALNIKDPGEIVIDEVAGQAIALIFAGTNLYLFIAGFFLFRLFDITKPWLVGWADKKLNGGLGIMLDDVFAGIFAAIVLYGIKFYLF